MKPPTSDLLNAAKHPLAYPIANIPLDFSLRSE